jgi:AbrB family looped-hinge helix DNA binding protein
VTETRAITVNGRHYSVTLERFDHYTEPRGPSYHGYYLNIEGHGLTLVARKYDDENEMSIQSGLGEDETQAIEIARGIARHMFGTERLSLLTGDGSPPYKKIWNEGRKDCTMSAADKPTTVVSTKGQVILPKAIRQRRGWHAGTRLVVEDTADGVLLRPAPLFPVTKREDVFGPLRRRGAPKRLEETEAGLAATRGAAMLAVDPIW